MKRNRYNIHLISDLHLGQDKDFIYKRRGFSSMLEHDEHIVKSWSYYINEGDLVYVLGDIGASTFFQQEEDFFKDLKGNKILVQGNHDKMTDTRYRNLGFDLIVQEVKLRIGKNKFIKIAHCPYKGSEKGYDYEEKELPRPVEEEDIWLVHGHVHHRWLVKEHMINVSYDMWKRPVHLHRDIRLIINKSN